MYNLFIYLLLIGCSLGSEIINSTSINGKILTYDALLGLNPNSTSGEVVLASPYVSCSKFSDSKNFTGKIVIVGPDICLPQEKVKHAIDAGAEGVLIEQYRNTKGLLRFYQNRRSDSFNISVLEISSKNVEKIGNSINSNETVFIRLNVDPNPIVEFGNGVWIFSTIFYAIYDLILILIISKKLWEYYKSELKTSKLTLSILFFDLGICILRIPILIDPTGLFGIYKWSTIEIFMTLDYGLTIAATLAITFVWDATYRHAMKFNRDTKRFKIHIILASIASSLLIILELLTNILRAMLLPAKPFLMAKVFIYFVSSVGVAIYFVSTGTKILNVESKGLMYKSMGKNIITCAVFLCLFAFTVPLVPTSLYSNPTGYFLLRFFVTFWVYNVTSTHMLLFRLPKKNFTSSSTKSLDLEKSKWKNTKDALTDSLNSDKEPNSDEGDEDDDSISSNSTSSDDS